MSAPVQRVEGHLFERHAHLKIFIERGHSFERGALLRGGAHLIKYGISDFVNWIRVMQAFDEEILCLLMYANVSMKTRLYLARLLGLKH